MLSTASVTVLASIGAMSVTLTLVVLFRILMALKSQCDARTASAPKVSKSSFAGQVVWVTGASSGIGRHVVLHLARRSGVRKIILSSRRRSELEKVAEECQQVNPTVEIDVLPLDLNDLESLPDKAKDAIRLAGGVVDVLINNGGVSTRSTARKSSFDVDRWLTNVDYLSYICLTKCLLPVMGKEEGRPGLIVNTCSVAGKVGLPVRTAYCGAKFALLGWFDALRLEEQLGDSHVHVVNLILGSARTDVARNALTSNTVTSFGDTDVNIESGLDPEFVAERTLAAAAVSQERDQNEIWLAVPKEMTVLFLAQYFPDTFKKILRNKAAKSYAIEKKGGSKED